MGEYGAIVWAAYGVAAIVLAVCAWASVRAYRKARAKLGELSK